MAIAIRAEHIGKMYQVKSGIRHDSLRDLVSMGLKSLVSREHRHAALESSSFWPLRDISFEIGMGQVVGIIGHNGAGKSTLLKILSRITKPTRGRVEISGRVGSLLEVGTGFHPELTGRENIYLNGAIIGMKKDEIHRQFDAIVEFSEIGRFLDTPVKRYSSGMYVRLAFAVAAHLEPEILLVDEVLAVGDIAFQKKCLGKIGSIAREGRTVVFISHNMNAVCSLCQRVLWVKRGELADDGGAADVVSRYLTDTSGGPASPEERWDDMESAPGNETVRLHRLSVQRQDRRTDLPLTMQTPFTVDVDFWNQVEGACLHVTLHVFTADGVIAFTTGRMNSGTPMRAGLFRSTVRIPGNLLNSGLHRLAVLVVRNSSTVLLNYESELSFNVIDALRREGACYGREPGVVQPALDWETEFIRGALPATA